MCRPHRPKGNFPLLNTIRCQADPAIGEESREGVPALENIVHGIGHVGMTRELGAFPPHPDLKPGNQRPAAILSCRETLFGAQAVDIAFNGKQLIDTPYRLQRQR
jgi:hypothetical protein